MNQTVAMLVTAPKGCGTAKIDPRSKLFLILAVGFVSYFIGGDVPGLLLILAFCVFVSFGGGFQSALKFFLAYLVIAVLNNVLLRWAIPGVSVIMGVFGVTLLKMLPIVMMGAWTLRTTNIDDLMVALQQIKMPQSVIIPLIVVFRYIPTLPIEYRMIKNAMKIRGICDTWIKRIMHPAATLEHILIPLLTRCLKVTEELSASGTTRGLGRNVRRYALQTVVFQRKDAIVIVSAALFLIILIGADHTYIGEINLWGTLL